MAEDTFDDEPSGVTEPRSSSRPKRTKKTLADGFLEAIRADFRAHGAGVIAEVRTEKPDQYLKIVLSVLPKDLHLNINSLEALSDDEIRQRIRGLEAVLRPFLAKPGLAKPGLAKPGLAKPGHAKPGLDGKDRVSEPAEGIGPQTPR
ncbi:hypothetical protein [Mesorhizobium sp.]|uniref:hypothetical protein n=1 Tax=Mesorhizobium sp. TaxID=1871066 RepID=UPI0025CDD94D|nr:hypothetical protein [Mesorhizobium sp.]